MSAYKDILVLVLTEDIAYTIMKKQSYEIRRGYHIRL